MESCIQFLGEKYNNRLYIKREDLIPLSFGGNKARKAENFFRELDRGGYDCVVSYGSGSSNHCRIVSNMAASRGIPCCIISPAEASKPSFNSKMMELFGAEITVVPVAQVHDTIENKLSELRQNGKKPYFIPGGGHGNLGTRAYVQCHDEICRQERELGVHFDRVFFASGTGTTQAGLLCGELINPGGRQIIGISIARKNPRGRDIVYKSALDFLRAEGYDISPEKIDAALIFDDSYTGEGYGRDNPDIEETVRDVLINYGIPLDFTYTGKAFTGMKKYIEEKHIQGENILFIHTGGTPLFFDDIEKLIK